MLPARAARAAASMTSGSVVKSGSPMLRFKTPSVWAMARNMRIMPDGLKLLKRSATLMQNSLPFTKAALLEKPLVFNDP